MSEAELRSTIDTGFSRIHGRLDDVQKQLSTIQGECKHCQLFVSRHEIDLRGTNGNPGLKTEVALLKQEQKRLGDPSRRSVLAQRTSIGAAATAAGTLIWYLASLLFGTGK